MLDRPNPAGRPVEGLTLRPGWESFVGAGPMPMRHGLTLGELGRWFIDTFKLDVDYRVIEMEGYEPDAAPGFGWPLGERIWINPSPNARQPLDGARLCRHGDAGGHDPVRGPGHHPAAGAVRRARHRRRAVDRRDARARAATGWRAARCATAGSSRPSTSMSASCAAASTSTPRAAFYDHQAFRPWRLQALAFKAIRRLYPDYDLWRDFPYEYEFGKLAIDVINGGPAAARMGRRCGRRRRATSTRSRCPTSRPGWRSAGPSCSTRRVDEKGRNT